MNGSPAEPAMAADIDIAGTSRTGMARSLRLACCARERLGSAWSRAQTASTWIDSRCGSLTLFLGVFIGLILQGRNVTGGA